MMRRNTALVSVFRLESRGLGVWYEKVGTIAVWGYVLWMIPAGRTLCWANRDHPNYAGFKSRWVHRGEEPGLYWFMIAVHILLVGVITYIAFFE
jgi:hypothetical protein